MDQFHQHSEEEEEEEETEIPLTLETSGRTTNGIRYRYKECLKNQAVGIGKQAVDGCLEFMAAGGEGTLEALKCAACNCHRNFHRKEPEQSQAAFQHQRQYPYQIPPPPPATFYYHHHQRPAGYLHVNQHPPPLALPSTTDNLEETSNPASSSGGGGSGGRGGGSKKRFRTKFTESQKERMLVFAEGLGWHIQKEDEGAVQQFCDEIGIRRKVLKVWMHNNKHTLGKKP